jgi:tetratricopeptide (TPR) repeat protein
MRYPGASEEPEIRFLLATTLKKLDQKVPALEHVFALLKSAPRRIAASNAALGYWQQRAGNEIGNQLYQEADYPNALQVYTLLAALNSSPGWKLPAWYQIGLVYERLEQPQKALEIYAQIEREKELASNGSPTLKMIIDMARWRSDFLNWTLRHLRQRARREGLVAP